MKIDAIITTHTGIKHTIAQAAQAELHDVIELSKDIHANPELAFAEFESATKVKQMLLQAGFVEKSAGRLPTAIHLSTGTGEIGIALCVEYDALPNGHACGHNLILGAGVLAALALKPVVDQLGITLSVIGTPAEEGGGGKLYLLQDGAFDDSHCALMIHAMPDGSDCSPLGCTSQAVARWRASYHGKAAHAAGAPDQGVNAADAVVIAQVAVGLLRQQLTDGYRTNMVVREAGKVTNVIADTAIVEFEARAPEIGAFAELYQKVARCFEAGALATGCTVELEQFEPTYQPLLQDPILSQHWCANYGSFGRDVSERPYVHPASTDFGNVGQVMPALHPWIAIPGVNHPLHSEGFRDAVITEPAFETMMHGALGMAFTVVDLMNSPADLDYLRERKKTRSIDLSPIPGHELHISDIK